MKKQAATTPYGAGEFCGGRFTHKPTRSTGIGTSQEEDVLDYVTHLTIKTDDGRKIRDAFSALIEA